MSIAASDAAEKVCEGEVIAPDKTEAIPQMGMEEPEEPMDIQTTESEDDASSRLESENVEKELEAADSNQAAERENEDLEGMEAMEVEDQDKDIVQTEESNIQSTDSSDKNDESVEKKDDNTQSVESSDGMGQIAETVEDQSSSSQAEDGNESAQIPESGTSDTQIIPDEGEDSLTSEREGESIPVSRSDTGDTEDSAIDQSAKDGKDNAMEQFLKPPVKIFDECSMESFVSAKSSEFDYGDSLQGSPLPVKRVRELIDESPRASPVPSKRSRASSPASHDTDAANRSDDE